MRSFIIGNARAIIKLKGKKVIMRGKAEADINRVFRLNMRPQDKVFIRADKIGPRAIGCLV